MRRSTGPRKTANLSESIQKRLNMYVLVAGAAGVGMLAPGATSVGEDCLHASSY